MEGRRVTRAEDIADEFATSIRTVYRDIAALAEAGVPIIGEAGVGYSIILAYLKKTSLLFFLQVSPYQFKVTSAEIAHVIVLNAAHVVAAEMIFVLFRIAARPGCFTHERLHRLLPRRGGRNRSQRFQLSFFCQPCLGGFLTAYFGGFRTFIGGTTFGADVCHVIADTFGKFVLVFVFHNVFASDYRYQSGGLWLIAGCPNQSHCKSYLGLGFLFSNALMTSANV